MLVFWVRSNLISVTAFCLELEAVLAVDRSSIEVTDTLWDSSTCSTASGALESGLSAPGGRLGALLDLRSDLGVRFGFGGISWISDLSVLKVTLC